MTQPSVAHYFNTRKRPAIDDCKDLPRKVLILDQNVEISNNLKDSDTISVINITGESKKSSNNGEFCKGPTKIASLGSQCVTKVTRITKTKKNKEGKEGIQTFLNNMKLLERCVTPPNDPEEETNNELNGIKKKLYRSSKLNQLKESINNFKQLAGQLEVVEKRTKDLGQSPKLKNFKSVEFEVSVSPQKLQSPEKPYLSPKKESSVRRNLLGVIGSPNKVSSIVSEISTKEIPSNAVKQGLKLPYKYRTLTEIFRAIDTVSQILYNRKEVITLVKLKPAVEEMLKKTLTRKHLAQIKYIYPNAYDFRQEKLKQYGNGIRQEEWNLVVIPNIETTENMTSEILLKRRRKLYETLIELVKNYHNEFLLSLNPPMIIEKDQITRWHPEFDIEKVPDIEESNIPQTPVHEKFTTGKEVLEKARQIFNCNTRMEQALAKLKAVRGTAPLSEEENPVPQTSILKGIPKALLEKVRQKQVAKALVSMTRSVDKDKEVQLYCRLPEIARFTRSVFVSEKKCVLQLDMVAEKLGNSYRCFLNKTEIEDHLRVISREIPEWLEFHEKRNSVFLKLNKNADLSVVINKLEKLAKEKSEF